MPSFGADRVLLDTTTPGAFTSDPLPSSANGTVMIEIWAPGGWGANTYYDGEVYNDGYGGGAGGNSQKILSSQVAGATYSGVVGTANNRASITQTTITSPAMTANPGTNGSLATPGSGGTASGGDTNTTGGAGGIGTDYYGGASNDGGSTQTTYGAMGNSPGGGGGGAAPVVNSVGGEGGVGRVRITYCAPVRFSVASFGF